MRRALIRIAIIALAAAVCIGMSSLYAHSLKPPPPRRGELRGLRRRDPNPRLDALPKFMVECVVFAGITTIGCTVLRLRLSD
jgi:hypothetical protein